MDCSWKQNTWCQQFSQQNTKIRKTENKVADQNHLKYITTSEFNNNLTGEAFTARLAQAYLVTKTDFDQKS